MPVPKGTTFRIKTYPSGVRVRLAIWNGRVVETKRLSSRKPTRTQKHLNRARRRIARR